VAARLIVVCEAAPPETAQKIVDLAQANAPMRTGFLRDSIHTAPGDGEMSSSVIVEAYYAPFVELGTRFMSAEPFFFPAVEQVGGQFESDISDMFAAML
jgi:HK97 gp10 family phage protein